MPWRAPFADPALISARRSSSSATPSAKTTNRGIHPSVPGRGMSTTRASSTSGILHRAVDLAGPHPNSLAVDGRVGAAVDHGGAPRGDLDPVAVPPDCRVLLEVARPVPRAVAVAPQKEGHRGHRLGDHELAHLVDDRVALLVEGLRRRRPASGPGAPRGRRRAAERLRRRPCRRRCPRRSRTARCRARAARTPTRTPRATAATRSSRSSEGGRGPARGRARSRPSCSRRCSWRWSRSRSPRRLRRGPTEPPCPAGRGFPHRARSRRASEALRRGSSTSSSRSW